MVGAVQGHPGISSALAAVRRRRRALALLHAFGLALLALSIGWGGAAAGGLSLPAQLRVPGALAVFLLALFVPLWRHTIPAFRRSKRDVDVAAALDDLVPDTGASLFAAVDVAASTDGGEERQALVARAESRALAALPHIRPAELHPLGSIGRPAWAGLCLFGTLVVLSLFGPATTRDRLLLRAPASAADPGSADDDATLVLRNLRLRLVPPAHASSDPLVLDGTTGDFDALPGTTVEVEATVPAGVEARIWWGEVQHPATLDDGALKGAFTTRGEGFWWVEITRSFGREPLRTRKFRVGALRDGAPRLEVLGPGEVEVLAAGQQVPLQIRTSDDHGLASLVAVLSVDRQSAGQQSIAPVQGLDSWEGLWTWEAPPEVASLAGRLELVIEACDADSVAGPKCTRATALRVRLSNDDERQKRAEDQLRALTDAAVDWLADSLLSHAGSGPALDFAEGREQHRQATDHAERVLTLAEEAIAALAADKSERRDRFNGLVTIRDNLRRRWVALDDHARAALSEDRLRALPRMELFTLQEQRLALIGELERAVLDLSAFVDQQRGARAAAESARAENTLDRLSELARAGAEGQDVSAEVQKELQALQQQIAQLAEALASRMPAPSEGFTNQVPGEMGADALSEIERLMREGKFEEAAQMLQKARDALAKMREQLQEEQKQSGSQEQEALAKEIDEALDEAQKIQDAQQALRNETQGQRDTAAQNDLMARAAALRDAIAALPRDMKDPDLQRSVAGATRRLVPGAERLGAATERGELDAAALEARDLAEGLDALAQDLGAPGSTGERGQRAAAARRAAQQAAALAESLERAAKAPQGGAGGQGGLAQRQEGLGERLQRLQQKVERIGGGAFNPAEGREQLQRAAEAMRSARQRLGTGQSGRAAASQDDAISQLQQFRDAMGRSRQGMGQEPMGTGQPGRPGGGPPSGRGEGMADGAWDDLFGDDGRGEGEVVMPREEDFVGPEAYRQLLQEGAAGEVPESWKPLQNEYYEELAR